jgi:predicted HTH transcriptional regulator
VQSNEKVLNEGVLKAVVGELNGKGGKVIVGVLEAERFRAPEAQPRLKALPRAGDYAVCGVNEEYGKEGWDHYQRRLQDAINTKTVPSPQIWVSIKRDEYQGRDVCVISVRPPIADWFYLKADGSFFVRHGNETRSLSGPEADNYRRNNAR